jgi:hypothetical protein
MSKKLCGDMIAVYEHLSSVVKHRREYAKSWTDFLAAVQRMTLTQIPELTDGLSELAVLVQQFAQIHTNLSDKEERTAEDIRDVYERFDIVFRAGEEVGRRRAHFTEASKALQTLQDRIKVEETRPNYEKAKYKYERDLAIAKTNKADALRRLKTALAAVIEHKKLYNSFKIRRLSHGWHLYASALREAAEQELEVFGKIRDHLATLDGAITVSPEASIALEAAVEAAPPEPVPAAVVETAISNLPEPEPIVQTTQPEPIAPVLSTWADPQPEPIAPTSSEPVASGWSDSPTASTGWPGSNTAASSPWDEPTTTTPAVDTGNPFD